MEAGLTFEEAMQRLELIVKKLESGKETLDDSLVFFEEGAKLSAYCYQKLKEAEQKIQEISKLEESETNA